ncbi:MAG: AI-2E family transporter [Cellulosilyticaceae bacterium]
MKFEKNNKYFTICVYAVVSTLIVIGLGIALFNIKSIWGGLIALIRYILELLKPLIIGIVIAYLLDPLVGFYTRKCKYNPLCKWQEKRNKDVTRTVGTSLTALTLVALVGLFVLIITLNVNAVLESNKVEGFIANIKEYIRYFEQMLNNVIQTVEQFNLPISSVNFLNRIYGMADWFTSMIAEKTLEIATGIGSNTISIGLGIVVGFYLVQDKYRLLKGWNRVLDFLLPHKIRKYVSTIGKDLDYAFSGYIRGQLIDAVIMAGLISLALTLIGLDFAIIIGIIAGIFNIIPYFGPVVGFVLAGIIGSIGAEPQKAIYAMIAVLILQQIDGWFIVPKVIGDSVKLHPVIVLLAIVIGGELFGLAGILLGVPVAAFIRVTIMRYIGIASKE